MTPLIVILGAGASRGAGYFHDNYAAPSVPEVPPLTVDLFSEQKYGPILREYDLAHQAGRFIEQERAQDDALGLETVLHRLSDSEYTHHKHMALAVPPYLQYPALAAPEGPDDRLVLPQAHHEYFFMDLHRAQEIDMLAIGYSALDAEVLRLIKETRAKVRHITVVNQDGPTAAAVFARITNAGLNPVWNEVIDADFSSWSNDGGLTRLVEEYDGPYPRAT